MRSKLKRGMSLLLSVVMAMSGAGNVITASAEELAEENAVVNETELLETEAPVYSITLPYYEECSYGFDKEHLKEPVEEKKEIVLAYEADEKVEISLLQSGALELGEVRLSDQEKHDIPFEWKDENVMEFFMPAKDIWLEAVFVTLATEMMQTEAAIEIVQTEPIYLETEQVNESAAEEEIVDAGKSETEVLPEESEQEPESAGGDTAVEEETMIETEADGMEVPDTETAESEETESEEKEEVSYQEETDADGLPLQGSIVQVESITIPFDTWEFDQYSDFRNIPYDTDGCTIEYISDDIIYDAAGTYSSIYRVTDKESGKFWFVLRPVVVSEKTAEEVVETEAQDISVECETDLSESTTESEELIESEKMTEVITEEPEEMESEQVSETEVIEEAESEPVSETEVSELEFLIDAEVEPVMLLAEAEEEEADEEPVPDKFKLVVKGIYTAPSALKAGDASTTYKTVVFYESDGSTVTRMAYCIQPKETSPGSGQTYDKDDIEILDDSTSKDKKMMKAMYYLYLNFL